MNASSGNRRSGAAIWAAMLVASLGAFFLTAPAAAQNLDQLEVTTGSGPHAFSVELARGPQQLERGLMYRRFMPADRGMLFEFSNEQPVTFWMKNTYIPLDMVFISRKGVVTNIVANAEPMSEALIPSGAPCFAVLELNGGVAASIGLKSGDHVKDAIFQ